MNKNWNIRIGRVLYMGFSMVAVQEYTSESLNGKDFRPGDSYPRFRPGHIPTRYFLFLWASFLVIAGILIAGFYAKKICLFLGSFFLVLIITCYLPYILFTQFWEKLTNIVVWFRAGEALAYGRGAFVMAGSYSGKPILVGRIFLLPADLSSLASAILCSTVGRVCDGAQMVRCAHVLDLFCRRHFDRTLGIAIIFWVMD